MRLRRPKIKDQIVSYTEVTSHKDFSQISAFLRVMIGTSLSKQLFE